MLRALAALKPNPKQKLLRDRQIDAGRKNLILLVQLRWIAVIGQIITILTVQYFMGISLPLSRLGLTTLFLILINFASMALVRSRQKVTNTEIFAELLIDIALLTSQLYLTGGISNPFISLFLLQVVLGTVILGERAPWLLAGATILCFAFLSVFYVPLPLPDNPHLDLFSLYLIGSFFCFILASILLVAFLMRVTRNVRALDARVAELKQNAAEEKLILRMGLLASEAAHELGTPLSSLAVVLNDWNYMPVVQSNPDMLTEIKEMQAEVQRCKSIVTGILLSAGEARGENLKFSSINRFFDDLVQDWRTINNSNVLHYHNNFGSDVAIVFDEALKKVIFNILDNALQASPTWLEMRIERDEGQIFIYVTDRGPGFESGLLTRLGRPYQSSKGKPGGGLGLFLAVSVFRKLGGSVAAHNRDLGGAEVVLRLPLSALSLEGTVNDE